MNFEYQTINSDRFRKYKQIRYIIYIVLIVMLFLLVPKRRARYSKGDYFNLADMLGLNVPFVFLVTILLAVAALYLHFYSLKTQNIGQVCIDEKGIKLNVNNSLQNFDFNDIKGLKIERGSTWHYAYKKDNYLITFDNWLRFETNNMPINIEFNLASTEENKTFESMIDSLNKRRIQF
jgi:heme/copper-type cytochrome/quinol oxidase subunit 2